MILSQLIKSAAIFAKLMACKLVTLHPLPPYFPTQFVAIPTVLEEEFLFPCVFYLAQKTGNLILLFQVSVLLYTLILGRVVD